MTSLDACFHCGDALPDGEIIVAHVDGQDRAMCCIGCKAVAEFIAANKLEAFYDFRSQPDRELNLRPGTETWQHFDDPDLLSRYVANNSGHAETTIDIGGMYCSACVWLLDKAMRQVEGVESIDINPSVRRAIVRWNIEQLKFSELLAAIARIGFKPAPASSGQPGIDDRTENRLALKRLIVAGAAGMQVMMFAVALYAGDHFGIDASVQKFLRWISLLVTIPVFTFSARPFFVSAWRGLRARTPGMDLPVSIAIIAAFFASVYATWVNHGDVYFDSVVMFVFFLSATRFLEMRARHRSVDHATALAQLLPDTALRLIAGAAEKISLDRLRINDTISIRPGDVIPIDGAVITGKLDVDESMLTGESAAVTRQAGELLFAGAIVRTGNATVKVLQVGASTSLAEIGRMIDRAKADRPRIALLADKIAGKFVLAVLAIAATAGLAWVQIDASRAFAVTLAILVVTCPCALALATPAALAAATSRLARSGMLLVRANILQVLSQPASMVFDKTGTLTEGRPTILRIKLMAASHDEASVLGIAASLESVSEHVLARAFAEQMAAVSEPTEVQVVAGRGVEATLEGQRFRIGSESFVAELCGASTDATPDRTPHTRVFLGNEQEPLAQFLVGDALRSDACESIAAIQAAGFTTIIASGDHEYAVGEVAKQLGIVDWHAGLSPADKLELLERLRGEGDTVVMVGDGINDAPVLAAADASIALDAGTVLARASADAVSLGRRLGTINMAIEVATRTQNVIRQNIAWAVVYNATAVPLAVSGLLAPWMAAIGMSLSSLIVVLNALRLQRMNTSDARS